MKVYTAAPFKNQSKMKKWRKTLIQNGFEVTSRWLDEESNNINPKYGDNPKVYSVIDLVDIDDSEALILDASEPSFTGGKHFETGYAYATNKKVVIVGAPENVFHFLPEVTVVKSLKKAMELLNS